MVPARSRCLLSLSALLFALTTAWGCAEADSPLPGANNAPGPGDVNNVRDCTDFCMRGERICQDESTVLDCVLSEAGCFTFGAPSACDAGAVCENGTCVGGDAPRTCDDECTIGDAPRCNAGGELEKCADHDGNGCRTYGGARPCPAGEVCNAEAGRCEAIACEDVCAAGESRCDGARVATCRADARGCLRFVDARECPRGQTCEDGACREAVTCEDECEFNATVCALSTGERICDDWDGDGCLEYSEVFECLAGEECRGGECVSSAQCQDRCFAGEAVCAGNLISTCADHDGDGCLEFDDPKPCASAAHTCQRSGAEVACRPDPAAGAVVLNEIFYDPLGADLRGPGGASCTAGQTCSSPAFIELFGPPGMSVASFRVEMVNGADGRVYNQAVLPGDARLDGNGYAVLAMDQPDGFMMFAAPAYTNVYYVLEAYASGQDALQNGPDSVVLLDAAGDELDAVGYGFAPGHSAHFRGRGDSAPATTSGRSLGRVAGRANTDDNAADFRTHYPTPGLPNQDLVINEIYTNQPGPNDGSEAFVELAAPILGWEDLRLDGYVLRAIAGGGINTGEDYIHTEAVAGISLAGVMLNDGGGTDGLVTLCHEAATTVLRSVCSVSYEGVPFYPGPDNFVLQYQGRPIDAIGYGTFRPGDAFLGEGTPAPYESTDAGMSLGRWPLTDPGARFDTDDNRADFWLLMPTPGRGNPRP